MKKRTPEEICRILNKITTGVSVTLDKEDYWALNIGMEIREGGILLYIGELGSTPGEAIQNTWDEIVNVRPPRCLVVNAGGGPKRKELVWIDELDRFISASALEENHNG